MKTLAKLDKVREIYKEGVWTTAAGKTLPLMVELVEAQHFLIEMFDIRQGPDRTKEENSAILRCTMAWNKIRELKIP